MPLKKPAKKAAKKVAKKAPAKSAKKVAAKKRPLTTKQQVFMQEYLGNGFCGVKAARAAGYQGDTNTLNQVARDNLQNPTIHARIQERIEGVAATADEVLNLLGHHLRADVAGFEGCFTEDGRLDLKEAKAKGVSRLVKKLRTTTRTVESETGPTVLEVTTQLEFHDAQSAARTLVEVLGLKQMPRENDDQRKHDEEMAESVREEIARLIAEGWKAKDARAIVLDAHPEASQWLQ
ncbi:MAG TPA: terminase small subunit [Blastocatellia bacterium]|nr:terminase small subunit [Blastocatellia bacterium]HMX27604.1 terminase small subunit [Blastocatellia bacterium]HMZ22990.1 terminase small subunit [Blastocatellia bacterium]